jgi:hypothetical protein
VDDSVYVYRNRSGQRGRVPQQGIRKAVRQTDPSPADIPPKGVLTGRVCYRSVQRQSRVLFRKRKALDATQAWQSMIFSGNAETLVASSRQNSIGEVFSNATSRYCNPWPVFGVLAILPCLAFILLIGGGTRFVRVLVCMQLIDILVLVPRCIGKTRVVFIFRHSTRRLVSFIQNMVRSKFQSQVNKFLSIDARDAVMTVAFPPFVDPRVSIPLERDSGQPTIQPNASSANYTFV